MLKIEIFLSVISRQRADAYICDIYMKYLGLIGMKGRMSRNLNYRGADKSLARPGRKQATATDDFEFHISYL